MHKYTYMPHHSSIQSSGNKPVDKSETTDSTASLTLKLFILYTLFSNRNLACGQSF